ncbi:mannosyl-oligosaccharide alpha-1,2-mannosidase [Podila humilis]|nr:mannosyl-oligosaccharide alpha-1,2-mannosidase [Podila humilis]
MYKKDEKSNGGGIPFHLDDNKYSKSSFSSSKTHSRIRIRKRHAMIAFCLLAMTYVIVRTSTTAKITTTTTFPSRSRGGVHIHVPIADRKVANTTAATTPTVSLSAEEVAAAAAAAAQARAEERRRLKKKKKNPPSLFDYVDQTKNDNNNNNKNNNKNKKNIRNKNKNKNKNKDKGDNNNNNNRGDNGVPVVPPVEKQQEEKNTNNNNTPSLWEMRKNRVKDAFQHAWSAYRRDAWGKDEYHPISKYGSNMVRNGQGFTIVDSLDTLWLMGFQDEFQEAKEWVRDELNFDKDDEVNLFETTIRVLGGLLSAYDQSGKTDRVFLDKAVDLADRLMGAFEGSSSDIPFASVHLREKRGVPGHDRGISSTSEVSTLQLEFKYLTFLTGDDKYWKAAEKVLLKMRTMTGDLDGLVPIFIDPYKGTYSGDEIRLGSRGDSYYEYLIKQYLQTGKQEPVYKDMYDHAMSGVKKHLLGRTASSRNLLFVGEISKYAPEVLSPKMDHLVCFLGGTMALASTEGHVLDPQSNPRSNFNPLQETDFHLGEELTKSCYEMYRQTETGLAPEIVHWVTDSDQTEGKTELQYTQGNDFYISDRDSHNWLRPETVESLFYMWRLTGDEKYRHWGWNIFESIERYSKVESGGFSSIHDIRRSNHIQFSDKMETFFLAETLKYLYLLFGPDDVLPLDKYVFNTEAHPLPIFTPSPHLLVKTQGLRGAVAAPALDKSHEGEDEEDRHVGSDEDEEEDSFQPSDADDEDASVDDSGEDVPPNSSSGHQNQNGSKEGQEGDENDLPFDVNEEDEMDQGMDDISHEDEEVEDSVAEVEVDLEDDDATSADDGEEEDTEDQDQDEDQDQGQVQEGEDGDYDADYQRDHEVGAEDEDEDEEGEEEEEEEEPEDDEDGELGVAVEEEEDEDGSEPAMNDDETDEFEEGGDDFGVVNPQDWEDADTEAEGEEEIEEKDLL